MSGARQETVRKITVDVIIPIHPPPTTADNCRPSLGRLINQTTSNPNGQCLCWDLIIPALHLLEDPKLVIRTLCVYHRAYFGRRINLGRTHSCPCHYDPDTERCYDCGYCHRCGCDLVTTSTPEFHRCSCSYCLTRCCPHDPTTWAGKSALRQHNFLRARQAARRCPVGAPPSDVRHPEYKLSQVEIEELDKIEDLPSDRTPSYLTEDDPLFPLIINCRWPSEDGSPSAVEQNSRLYRTLPGRPTKDHHDPSGSLICP